MEFLSSGEVDDLLDLLWHTTEDGQLEWQAQGSYNYVANNASFRFLIYPKDDDGLPPFGLLVERGDTALDNILEDDGEVSPQSSDTLRDLYALVKRKTAGGDKTVRELLEGLRKLREEPPF